MRWYVRLLLTCSLVAVALPVGAQSQGTATIRGRVLDQTGASAPGATVTVTNTQTGAIRETSTDTAGFYAVAALPLTGTYRITIALQGFATKTVDDVRLRAGETATIDATLEATGGTSEVTVFGTAAGVRTDEPQLGVRLDEERIESTPVTGRKMTNLPLLDSAVRPAINTGDVFLNNTMFVIDGSGRRQTTFTLDGSSADDAWGRQTAFTNVPLSAIQDFTVLSNAFSAEYGRTTGAAINIVTKSGTNTARGDVLYSFRPGGLEADSVESSNAQTGAPVTVSTPPDVLNQLSGSVGGPIAKDRTHYFVAAEYNHQRRDSAFTTPVEPPGSVYTGHYNQGLLDARVDHSLGAARVLTFKANIDAFTDDNPQGVVGGLVTPSAGRSFTRHAYGGQAGYTSLIGAAFLNDVHFQVFFGSPITQFTPLTPSTQYVYPGYATYGESRFADLYSHQYELADTVTWSRGRHELRAGGTLMHSTSGGNGQEFGSPFVLGQFTVKTGVTTPIANLTSNDIQTYTQGFGDSTYEIKEWVWSTFVQDDVKLRNDLTANLGLRYERQTFTDDTHMFSPRLGVTYNVAGDPRTVLRGGYGLYFSEVRTNAGASWELGGPTGFFSYTAAPGQPGFPNPLSAVPITFPPGASLPARNITIRPGMASYYSQFFDVSKLKGYPDALLNPYTNSVTVGLERELGHGWFAGGDYVKQHTNNVDRPLDLNSPSLFVRTQPGQVRTAAAADLTRPIVPVANGYRQIFTYLNNGVADYDALQLNLRKTTIQYALFASYTLAKVTNTVEPDVPGQAPNDANDTGETERGPSLLEQPNRFVLSGWYRLPYAFSVGGVITQASGYHYNITTGTDNNGDGSNTDRPVVSGAVMGRNAGTGNTISQTDIFVERAFRLQKERQIVARVELFNLFNHANVAGYNGTYGNATSGVPLTTLGTPLTGVANVFPGRQVGFMLRARF